MDLFNKKAPWVAATILAAVSAFGQTNTPNNKCAPSPKNTCEPGKFYEQGHELVCTQMMAAYNAPARIDVRCAWDVYATGSFIYWQPTEDNLELGIANHTPIANIDTIGIQGNVINMDFDFKPGFKVGLGMNFDHDNWDGFAEYTWLRGKDSTHSNGFLEAGSNILNFWGHPHYTSTNAYNNGSADWKFKFDFVDANLARSYYVGKMLSFRPYFGARAAWIRQSYIANYVNDGSNGINVLGGGSTSLSNITVTNRTRSWGVGPAAGIGTNWMIGQGFRFYGDAEADILYTRYKVQYKETDALVATYKEHVKQSRVDCLRTHLDLEMGIGWGTYFDNNSWHVDLSASYGFQVFFDQNMFRHYNDDAMIGNSTQPNGNLYVNGLTTTARFDF